MALTRVTTGVIEDGAITTEKVANLDVSYASPANPTTPFDIIKPPTMRAMLLGSPFYVPSMLLSFASEWYEADKNKLLENYDYRSSL